eukprot:TRINITY_DN176_c0_g1_i8.p1 TRINITY_DN176_c0_g1~~TRINITY_DN176_c0_g1_i8.p1  ORF type:complete len:357 (+),score=89.44 TRINITY_DN176_c0_g1_i8:122-1192(+)
MGRSSTAGGGGSSESDLEKRARLKLVRYRIGQAILRRAEVWMSYDGGTVVKLPRPIAPKTWGTEPISKTILREVCSTGDHHHRYFRALCLNSNMIKTFAVHKVLEVRSGEWALGDAPEDDKHYAEEMMLLGTARQGESEEEGDDDDEEEEEEEDEDGQFAMVESSESVGSGGMPWDEMVQCAQADYKKYCQENPRSKRRPKHVDLDASELKEARTFLATSLHMRLYISPASFPHDKIDAASLLVGVLKLLPSSFFLLPSSFFLLPSSPKKHLSICRNISLVGNNVLSPPLLTLAWLFWPLLRPPLSCPTLPLSVPMPVYTLSRPSISISTRFNIPCLPLSPSRITTMTNCCCLYDI